MRMPPAADVPSMTTNASPAGRWTSTITPVEVSLCGYAYTSPSTVVARTGVSPGAVSNTCGIVEVRRVARHLARTSKRTRRSRGACSCVRPDRTTPRPRTSWSRRGRAAPRSRRGARRARAMPLRTWPTTERTPSRRWLVPRKSWRDAPRARPPPRSRTFDGPEPNRPSLGNSSGGSLMGGRAAGLMAQL